MILRRSRISHRSPASKLTPPGTFQDMEISSWSQISPTHRWYRSFLRVQKIASEMPGFPLIGESKSVLHPETVTCACLTRA